MAAFDFKQLGPLRIAVLAGGTSLEREVSLASGSAVSQALRKRGHSVTELDPARVALNQYVWDSTDVVFLALHGTFGEDGQIQEILELAGVLYTGSDSATSRLAFSKSASKERFSQSGVPTPPYVLIHKSDDFPLIERHAQALGYPLAVKPDRQGSSLGVSIIEEPAELRDAVTRCFQADTFGLLESAVVGSEWTMGFLDQTALPPIQIETDRGFFDYTAKYEDDETRYRFDVSLPATVLRAIELAASRACAALQTSGIVRVDIRVDHLQRPWVLEVNTIPGFTSHSLIPMAAKRQGMELGELCERAIDSCFAASARSRTARTA